MSDPNTQSPNLNAPAAAGAASMTTPETLAGIFFEPERTFEALRERPRFLIAALVIVLIFLAFNITYFTRVGYDRIIRAETEVSTRNRPEVTAEQKQKGIDAQSNTVVKMLRWFSPIIFFAVFFAAGGALYMLGSMLMGGSLSYKQAITVWTYSTLPVMILMTLLNFVLLFLKPLEDDFDIVQGAARGLVRANAGLLVDGKAHPVLATGLGALDILAFYGLFLAALGLRKLGRMSSGMAWGIVLTLWVLGVLLRILMSVITGNPI